MARDYKDPKLVCYAQTAYDKYKNSNVSATLKAGGGNYGGQ